MYKSALLVLTLISPVCLSACADDSPGEACPTEVCQQDPDFSGGVDESGADEMGELDGFGGNDEPSEIGEVIDSFCGVDAFQNGPDLGAVQATGDYGLQWQCTELAYRFICTKHGLCQKKVGAYGHAKSWFANGADDPALAHLVRFENGGSEPPLAGDVIVWGVGQYGHVAIVRAVLDSAVHVLEQNVYGGTHLYGLTASEGKYTVKGALGWMRAPNSVLVCDDEQGQPTTAALSSPEPNAIVEGLIHLTGIATDVDGLDKVTVTLDAGLGAPLCNGDCGGATYTIDTTLDPSQYGVQSGAPIELAIWVKDSLGHVSGPLATRTITWYGTAEGDLCGDAACTGDETHDNCCIDCACPSGTSCQGNTCVDPAENPSCGDGSCDVNESCATCAADCGCGTGLVCQAGQCVDQCLYAGTVTDGDYSCQGGVIMSIQGSINSAGNVTISATKENGETFGAGTYSVRVYDPSSGGGAEHCKSFNTEKAQLTVSGFPSQIVFASFASQLTCDGPEKAYCVTKLDGGDSAYWCSNAYEVEYQ